MMVPRDEKSASAMTAKVFGLESPELVAVTIAKIATGPENSPPTTEAMTFASAPMPQTRQKDRRARCTDRRTAFRTVVCSSMSAGVVIRSKAQR